MDAHWRRHRYLCSVVLGLAALLLASCGDGANRLDQPADERQDHLSYLDADGALWLVNADGSDRQKLADDGGCDRFSTLEWSPTGETLLCRGDDRAVFRDGDGNVLGELSDPDLGLSYWSPNGDYVLYDTRTGSGADTTFQLHIADRIGNRVADLGPWDAIGLRPPQLFLGSSLWSPSGEMLFYTRADTGEAMVYSVETGESEALDGNYYPMGWALDGEALLVAANYESPPGSLAFPSYEANLLNLSDGDLTRIPELDNGVQFWISPKGSHIVGAHALLQTEEADPPDIVIFDLHDGTTTPIRNSVFTYPSEGIPREHLVFSQDGQRVLWLNALPFMLYSAAIDGSDVRGPVTLGTGRFRFSPDRSAFAYRDFDNDSDSQVLYIQDAEGTSKLEIIRVPSDHTLSFAWRPNPR